MRHLNTDMKFELENIANLMRIVAIMHRKIGHRRFHIEPAERAYEASIRFDAATAIGFLRQYGLDKDLN